MPAFKSVGKAQTCANRQDNGGLKAVTLIKKTSERVITQNKCMKTYRK